MAKTPTTKLNLGCGARFLDDESWANADLMPKWRRVHRVNLNRPLPYRDCSFEFIYSSHVLDHFPLARAQRIVQEAHRCLKPGGVLRISVPDLAYCAQRYIQSYMQNELHPLRHEWHTIELIDQMTRTEYGGEKARFLAMATEKPQLMEWLKPLLGAEMRLHLDRRIEARPSLAQKIMALLKNLALRRNFETSGERHYWAFDKISLRDFIKKCGFKDPREMSWDHSDYAPFRTENLDAESGCQYKPGSIYMEAAK